MIDSQYLGTIQIWRNLNEHQCYLTSTKSVIFQIDANFSPFQSLNMVPFYIRLERLKLIYYGLISNFSKYYFKTGTLSSLYFLFSCSYIFTALEFESNYFNILSLKNSKAT